MNKLVPSIRQAIQASGLRDGMRVSFHHHLRNGDFVLNLVMDEIAKLGIRDITVCASAIFDAHAPLIEHIKSGVVTGIEASYIGAVVGRALSEGVLQRPALFRSHGGRPADITSGETHLGVAFIAAPAADPSGNLSGRTGKSACGSLGYAVADAECADYVVALTDNLTDEPIERPSIPGGQVDTIVVLPAIGDPNGIVSGTTRITRDPVGLIMARYAAEVIRRSGLLRDGFSFQTGAGGASLATAKYLTDIMLQEKVRGSFGMGGITKYMIDMLEAGLFERLYDVQCFDLDAVRSLRENPNHIEISAAQYASPTDPEALTRKLDVVILGATQIDTDFNVNVHTDSNGYIMGGSGGHSDTARGAKLSMVIAPLQRARLPLVMNRVLCVTTPGEDIDVLVTQRGIAVNPKNAELGERLKAGGLPVMDIRALKALAEGITGVPDPLPDGGRIVAHVKHPGGHIIDQIRQPVP